MAEVLPTRFVGFALPQSILLACGAY